jgi:hypothetical protein
MLTEALEKKEEEHIKFEEFSGLEEKYYKQANLIEGLKVDNDKLTVQINRFALHNKELIVINHTLQLFFRCN